MNLQEYKERERKTYNKFAKAVAKLLGTVIKEANKEARRSGGYCYQLQQIQSRAKIVDSLEKKLLDAGLPGVNDIEMHIKDLAACRIIFYGNYDVNHFLHSELIEKNFKIIACKTHFPKNNKPQSRLQLIIISSS